ncbi:MAG: hypothetical protein JW934_03795 [Anaerolineae bacterium]|nr:hypothetical protein [Anaerolineae bacterium]
MGDLASNSSLLVCDPLDQAYYVNGARSPKLLDQVHDAFRLKHYFPK